MSDQQPPTESIEEIVRRTIREELRMWIQALLIETKRANGYIVAGLKRIVEDLNDCL